MQFSARMLERAWPGAGKWLDRVSAVAEEENRYVQMSSLILWPGSTQDIVKECFFQDVSLFGQTE